MVVCLGHGHGHACNKGRPVGAVMNIREGGVVELYILIVPAVERSQNTKPRSKSRRTGPAGHLPACPAPTTRIKGRHTKVESDGRSMVGYSVQIQAKKWRSSVSE